MDFPSVRRTCCFSSHYHGRLFPPQHPPEADRTAGPLVPRRSICQPSSPDAQPSSFVRGPEAVGCLPAYTVGRTASACVAVEHGAFPYRGFSGVGQHRVPSKRQIEDTPSSSGYVDKRKSPFATLEEEKQKEDSVISANIARSNLFSAQSERCLSTHVFSVSLY